MEDSERQLLIFAHRDFPDAGLQVPGGTLDTGELPVVGVIREVFEETGLKNFSKVQKLGEQWILINDKKEIHHRHFFFLEYDKSSPNAFQHIVSAGELDQGLVFQYSWIPFSKLPPLAAKLDSQVSLLKNHYSGHWSK